jgi:hypothetical protein
MINLQTASTLKLDITADAARPRRRGDRVRRRESITLVGTAVMRPLQISRTQIRFASRRQLENGWIAIDENALDPGNDQCLVFVVVVMLLASLVIAYSTKGA